MKLRTVKQQRKATRKTLEKLHGYLAYVSGIEPYGRPFLAHLTMAMTGKTAKQEIYLSAQCLLGLEV